MSKIIDSIQLSGTVYTIQGTGGGGSPTVELTQAEYDALVSAGTVSANTYYIITDATAGDLTQYWTSAQTQSAITEATSGKASQSDLETVSGQVANKQDTLVSGTNIKTINNESILGSGNITIQGGGGVDSGTVQAMIDSSISGKVDTSSVVSSVTSASTDSEIPTAKAVYDAIPTGGTGGGKAIEAGRGISITTGATADTVSFNLPISAGTGSNSIIGGDPHNSATNKGSVALGGWYDGEFSYGLCFATGKGAVSLGGNASGEDSFTAAGNGRAKGARSASIASYVSQAIGNESFAIGRQTTANTFTSFAQGNKTKTTNEAEVALGKFNNSVSASTTFGDSGNTLFSVGNGTADNARHNAFEIRQNGDIYLTKDGVDIKLQDNLGGGKVDTSAITSSVTSASTDSEIPTAKAVYDSIPTVGSYVTTDTEQTISGRKIFTYSAISGKAIEFKQTSDSAKVGFRIINSAETNNEVASFEFRPNTFTIDNVQHPLLYFGHYRNTNVANAGVPQTVIGFRQYDQLNAAAYHYLMPLPEKAKTPFSLTTSFKDYYAPMGFKNGSTMITADDTGVVDLSSELGGLKLKKLTQAEYDALATKDSNVLYVIVG